MGDFWLRGYVVVAAVETGLSSIHVMENEQYTVEENRTVSTVHISSGATLTIPAGITLTVAEFLHNEGAVQNNGTLIIQPDDDSIGNDGTIQNNGVLTIQADLCNFGTVTNTGTLEVAGALHLNNDEALVNDGTMTVTGDVFHTAAITGSGKLTVNGTVHGALHDYAATGYTEELKDYDPKAVTSADKDELQDMLDEINTILDNENITTNG